MTEGRLAFTTNGWRHNICEPCFAMRSNISVDVARLGRPAVEPVVKVCCFCGHDTEAGITVRGDPETIACGGVHS